MKATPNFQRSLKDILDSDEELPIDYVEPTHVPAYKDDLRFQHLKTLKNDNSKDKDVRVVILNKKDAFCFQCLQRVSKDSCKWFIKFMLYKDLQSNFNFLQPCLIPNYKNY